MISNDIFLNLVGQEKYFDSFVTIINPAENAYNY